MEKAGRWLRSLLGGGGSGEKKKGPRIPDDTRSGPLPCMHKEVKTRWSFRRSWGGRKELTWAAYAAQSKLQAASAAVAGPRPRSTSPLDLASVKIQAAFRAHLARKALRALKGLVKIQALVRGYLVRKQATAALRCMQALVTIQARARARRARLAVDAHAGPKRQLLPRRPPSPPQRSCSHNRVHSQETSRNSSDNIKTIEIDSKHTEISSNPRNNYSVTQKNRKSRSQSTKQVQQISPSCSAVTSCTVGVDEDLSNGTAYYPNYMAKTESSRAKARRSQSAPRQRSDGYDRRRPSSVESRNIPRCPQMQRQSSSPHVDVQALWSWKLDRSSMSVKDSECGSTSTILASSNY